MSHLITRFVPRLNYGGIVTFKGTRANQAVYWSIEGFYPEMQVPRPEAVTESGIWQWVEDRNHWICSGRASTVGVPIIPGTMVMTVDFDATSWWMDNGEGVLEAVPSQGATKAQNGIINYATGDFVVGWNFSDPQDPGPTNKPIVLFTYYRYNVTGVALGNLRYPRTRTNNSCLAVNIYDAPSSMIESGWDIVTARWTD